MKAFEIPTVVASWLGLCLLAGLDPAPVQANFTFGTPTNLGAGINSSTFDSPDTLSADGLDLYISTGAVAEIRVAHRATVDSEWGPLVKLELQGNSPMGDSQPSLSADGLTLYFNSDRAGGSGSFDLWITTRATTQDNWGTPVNLGATVNSASWDWASKISADDLELYFVSNRPGGFGSHDLYVTTRATKEAPWGPPVNLGVTINSSSWEDFPYLSADGLSLFFNSNRPGGYGSGDIYMARRPTRTAPWGSPVNLGPAVNSPYSDGCPLFSLDGTMFYFGSRRPGGYGNSDIWQIPVIRIVDFNSDGKIDAKDMALFVANWGQDKPLCDIGPFPWGDGVVDEQDLRVLMESLMTPGPKASDIPCDVALSWISPSFVQTCDVYLGTSLEAVDTASRTNPQGVLVSQDQTASMYDPPGLLELSTTYYWRVDFVIADPAPAIYKGPVLQFTTAGLMYPLQNVTATASSASPGSGPERTVDGSGLDKNDGHSIDQKNMWWSMGTAPNWIEYEFDKVRNLHEMWVWNFNTVLEPFMGFGARTVKIEYSADGTAWTALADVPEFKRAPGKTGYAADTKVSFGGAPAKFVKLTIEKNWGGAAPQTGLSEVRFFALQNTAAAQP